MIESILPFTLQQRKDIPTTFAQRSNLCIHSAQRFCFHSLTMNYSAEGFMKTKIPEVPGRVCYLVGE